MPDKKDLLREFTGIRDIPQDTEETKPGIELTCDKHRWTVGDPSHLAKKLNIKSGFISPEMPGVEEFVKNNFLTTENNSKIVKPKWRPDMQITHIKIAKDVDISYTEPSKGEKGGVNTYKVSSQEQPVNEFRVALQSLSEHVPEILEIPAKSFKDLRVMGATFIYSKDKSGFTITSKMPVSASNSPAIFNTPNVYEEKDGGHKHLPGILFEKLDKLKQHAIDYINGERAEKDQPGLFDSNKDDE